MLGASGFLLGLWMWPGIPRKRLHPPDGDPSSSPGTHDSRAEQRGNAQKSEKRSLAGPHVKVPPGQQLQRLLSGIQNSGEAVALAVARLERELVKKPLSRAAMLQVLHGLDPANGRHRLVFLLLFRLYGTQMESREVSKLYFRMRSIDPMRRLVVHGAAMVPYDPSVYRGFDQIAAYWRALLSTKEVQRLLMNGAVRGRFGRPAGVDWRVQAGSYSSSFLAFSVKIPAIVDDVLARDVPEEEGFDELVQWIDPLVTSFGRQYLVKKIEAGSDMDVALFSGYMTNLGARPAHPELQDTVLQALSRPEKHSAVRVAYLVEMVERMSSIKQPAREPLLALLRRSRGAATSRNEMAHRVIPMEIILQMYGPRDREVILMLEAALNREVAAVSQASALSPAEKLQMLGELLPFARSLGQESTVTQAIQRTGRTGATRHR